LAADRGGASTYVTCSPEELSVDTMTDWASCPSPENTVELFCMTQNIIGAFTGEWKNVTTHHGYVSNYLSDDEKIRCHFGGSPPGSTPAGAIRRLKACARCLN
jgi:hypothetical protein